MSAIRGRCYLECVVFCVCAAVKLCVTEQRICDAKHADLWSYDDL